MHLLCGPSPSPQGQRPVRAGQGGRQRGLRPGQAWARRAGRGYQREQRVDSVKNHIPTDLVVVQEASVGESSSRLDRLLLYNLETSFVPHESSNNLNNINGLKFYHLIRWNVRRYAVEAWYDPRAAHAAQ